MVFIDRARELSELLMGLPEGELDQLKRAWTEHTTEVNIGEDLQSRLRQERSTVRLDIVSEDVEAVDT